MNKLSRQELLVNSLFLLHCNRGINKHHALKYYQDKETEEKTCSEAERGQDSVRRPILPE